MVSGLFSQIWKIKKIAWPVISLEANEKNGWPQTPPIQYIRFASDININHLAEMPALANPPNTDLWIGIVNGKGWKSKVFDENASIGKMVK